ncbi:MAG: TolC family protein, partial [Gammaproteobacteria bacterium]|nr:TolC family protein [Gammaproteobacteria bacterium]
MTHTFFHRSWALLPLLLTGACTTLPQNSGREDIEALIQDRGLYVEEENAANISLATYLNKPLTAENAIRVALVNNPQLRTEYARLGFAMADIYAAGRIRNPVFSASALDSNRDGEQSLLTFSLITSFSDFITRPARQRLAKQQFAEMKQSIAAKVISVAMETESAFYEFVAAKQSLALQQHIAKVGKLSTDLAQRYHAAGNLTARELAIGAAYYSQRRLDALDAEAFAYGKRAMLAAQMGVPINDDWNTPAQLPLPLTQEDTLEQLLDLALHSRLDLAAAKVRVEFFADRLGVEDWTRWLGELNIGIEHERETDGARLTGPTLEWELPILNQGQDTLLRTKAELQISAIEVERLQLTIKNNVHLAYAALLNAKARSIEHRDNLIPARTAAVARSQEAENFMLIGIFELLATKQQEYEGYQSYLESVRDYWLTRSRLAQAVGNSLPSPAADHPVIDINAVIAPADSVDHSIHGMTEDSKMKQMDHSEHSMEAPMKKQMDHSEHSMEAP